jgi:hypothetical protein
MSNFINLATLSIENMVKNTSFDNQVNYDTHSSSGSKYSDPNQSSSDPTSLSYLIRNKQIIQFKIAVTPEKEVKETIQEKK